MVRVLFLLFLIIIGCASVLPIITEEQSRHLSTRWPNITSRALNDGRRLYIDHCSGCHSLYVPSRFNEEQWKYIVKKMQLKAKLTDAEKELVLMYILAAKMK